MILKSSNNHSRNHHKNVGKTMENGANSTWATPGQLLAAYWAAPGQLLAAPAQLWASPGSSWQPPLEHPGHF